MLIQGSVAFTGERFVRGMDIRLEEGRVAETGERLVPLDGEEVCRADGDFILPGFVDVHIHGCGGQDTMRGEQAVRAMSRSLYRQGVAVFCPTTMSASPGDTHCVIEGIRAVMDRPEPEGARVAGAHMEAPFLQEERAGAQRKEFFTDPDWGKLEEMTGGDTAAIRLITLAPEREGSEAFVRRASRAGIHVSVGHSSAAAETVHEAAGWGADHVTHLFNAQTPLHHRFPGIPGAALTDGRLFCEMICDGIHLHPDTIRLAVLCKGAARALAITDAMEAAGMPDGEYTLGGQRVFVRAGEARLENGTLAGSVLTMRRALENLIRFGIDPETACAMCTSTPAASIGEKEAGRLRPGSPVPLTRWSLDWQFRGILG